jgi:hypothetical protein
MIFFYIVCYCAVSCVDVFGHLNQYKWYLLQGCHTQELCNSILHEKIEEGRKRS